MQKRFSLLGASNSAFQAYTLRTRLPRLFEDVKGCIPEEYHDSMSTLCKQFENKKKFTFMSSIHSPRDLHNDACSYHMKQWETHFSSQNLVHRKDLEDMVPTIITEMYFYHRIVDASGFFHKKHSYDPFKSQKVAGFMDGMSGEGKRIIHFTLRASSHTQGLENFFQLSLWGNKADLSLIDQKGRPEKAAPSKKNENQILSFLEDQRHFLLHDDSSHLSRFLISLERHQGLRRIDIVLDNAGLELINDLCLVYALLLRFPKLEIHLHAKWQPTFISDATSPDIMEALDILQKDRDTGFKEFGGALASWLGEGRLKIRDESAWTFPILFNALPDALLKDLSCSNLVIFKGDANYRRLVLDTKWDLKESLKNITSYLPFPVAACRTLKADLCTGIEDEKMCIKAEAEDKEWKQNGNWGIIQFAAHE